MNLLNTCEELAKHPDDQFSFHQYTMMFPNEYVQIQTEFACYSTILVSQSLFDTMQLPHNVCSDLTKKEL